MLFHVDRLYMMKRKGYEQMRPWLILRLCTEASLLCT
jgi:hypothetical protein